MESPYEYYDGKLGVKIKFLVHNKCNHIDSLMLISYEAINKRTLSKNCPEQQLRRASLNYCALIDYNTINPEWKKKLITAFGSPEKEYQNHLR